MLCSYSGIFLIDFPFAIAFPSGYLLLFSNYRVTELSVFDKPQEVLCIHHNFSLIIKLFALLCFDTLPFLWRFLKNEITVPSYFCTGVRDRFGNHLRL